MTRRPFVITATVWAVISLALLLFCFIKCEEKVVIAAREKVKKVKGSGAATFKALVTNQYFWALTALWMLKNSSDAVVGLLLPYYCKYIMLNDTWFSAFCTRRNWQPTSS